MSEGIKVGDKVRVSEDAPRMYLRTMSTKFLGAECEVFEIIDGNAAIASGRDYIAIPLMYLVKVDPDAEEDARIRQKEAELEAFRKSELDRVLHPEKYYTYEVTVDNVAMDWQRYEADLAKEIALKVANKYNDPKQLTEYAVKCAKAVAEGLKRK